jgi:dipeptidyl aminopeptidase/acylaminoacyl peptidase
LRAALVAAARPAQATFPGANGKFAFSTDQGDNPQIFTVNPDGSGETQLTQSSEGHASAPDWSPDGTKIGFVADATGTWQIYEMNADGTDRHQLLDDPGFDHLNPRFSPDGTKIAFARCPVPTCAIYVVNVNGSRLTQLTSPIWASFDPQWSPDGMKIAFDSNQDGLLSTVWVMNANGSNQQRLTDPAQGFYPDWSPDGTHIIFSAPCSGLLQGHLPQANQSSARGFGEPSKPGSTAHRSGRSSRCGNKLSVLRPRVQGRVPHPRRVSKGRRRTNGVRIPERFDGLAVRRRSWAGLSRTSPLAGRSFSASSRRHRVRSHATRSARTRWLRSSSSRTW